MALDSKELSTLVLTEPERESIIAFLSSAYARDKIDIHEYEKRLDLLNKFQTKEEAELLVRDLIINAQEITDQETLTLKMENRNLPKSALLTKKLIMKIKYSTIILDYTDIDLPDGKYEIQINGDISNITIKAPIQYDVDNQISSQMVTVNESNIENNKKWKRNVILKLTGELKKSEINIIRID